MKLSNGRNGWMLLAAGVIAWDVFVDDTLSEAFARAARTRRLCPPLIVVWAVLTAHLFDVLPERLDPFHMFLVGARALPVLKVRYATVVTEIAFVEETR